MYKKSPTRVCQRFGQQWQLLLLADKNSPFIFYYSAIYAPEYCVTSLLNTITDIQHNSPGGVTGKVLEYDSLIWAIKNVIVYLWMPFQAPSTIHAIVHFVCSH